MSDLNPLPPKAHQSLSARLLVLTVVFVMLAELFIYTPSVARFRKNYLEERIVRAHLATLAIENMPEQAADDNLGRTLLKTTDTYAIALRQHDQRILIAGGEMPPRVDAVYDLRMSGFPGWIEDAFVTLAQTENRILRIIGETPKRPGVQVEIYIDEAPMRDEMLAFSHRIFQLSLAISLFTAGLLYISLMLMFVRPMRRITAGMERFRRAPEDETRIFKPSDRPDEIGIAQRELAVMQHELRLALRQKDRLAMLGAAVTKVNHDLRNSLATAMLIGDRLAASDDPDVQRLVPRMFRAMDRAVNLCGQTLDYASATMPTLNAKRNRLAEIVHMAGETLTQEHPDGGGGPFDWRNEVPDEICLMADAAQMLRVFENLGRNAREAGASSVRVTAVEDADSLIVEIIDDGPGMPAQATEHLFQPFAGSAREGGTGLGLVIAREVIHAHGGEIALAATGPEGTAFRLRLKPA
ncbi:MAG TPA: sensor histidine kinase [Rhodospirillaceae bacterium]|jgi:signal transduction histidine kinase|nr:histidine kinase [Magnetovibrio sp.]HCS71620.1 sensor histidine kinase [Rhodospirillaceae bacterium]|tara:strand:- start:59462 stop:60865 length:1404 start_codon:yes stop_codon:yes gene_type:complete